MSGRARHRGDNDEEGVEDNAQQIATAVAAAVTQALTSAAPQVTAAQIAQAIVQAQQAQQNQAAQVAQPAVFALTPGTANQGVLDYTTERGSHVYKEAIKSLYRKGEDSFSGEEEQLQTFLNRLERGRRSTGSIQEPHQEPRRDRTRRDQGLRGKDQRDQRPPQTVALPPLHMPDELPIGRGGRNDQTMEERDHPLPPRRRINPRWSEPTKSYHSRVITGR